MEPELITAASYLRTSGEGQRDNTSLPIQRADTDDLIKRSKWSFVRCYVDECKSGSTIAGRDDFQQMMKDAAKGDFKILVVYDITRFGRDGADIIESTRALKRDFGVDVVDTKGTYDTRDRSRTLGNYVNAGMAEQERLRIMERTIRGRIAKAQAGKPWSGNPPIGRVYDKSTGKWAVTETGRTIAEILSRYVGGESLTELCRENGKILRSKISQWVWHGQLAGVYSVRFESVELGIDTTVLVPAIPPVVSDALLEKARLRLQHNRTHNRIDVKKYRLSGFVRCEHCGKALTAQTHDEVVYYRHRDSSDCTFRGVRGNQLESGTLDYLYRFFLDEPAFERAVMQACPPPEHRDRLAGLLGDAQKRLVKNEAAVGRLVDAIAAGADVGLLLSKQAELKSEAVALRQRMQDVTAEIAMLPNADMIQRAAQLTRFDLMQQFRDRDWRSLPHDDVKKFLERLFGVTSKKASTGIFIHVDQSKRLVATFKGEVAFYHRTIDGRPQSKLFDAEADRLNAEVRNAFQKSIEAIGGKDGLKPSTLNKLSVPPN